MPSAPRPHTPDDEELVALYALGILDTHECQGFKPHLVECAVCQALLAQDRQTLALLGGLAPEIEPSSGFKQRLLRLAADEPPNSTSPEDG